MSTFEQPLAEAPAFTPATLTPTLPLQIAERIGAAIVEERYAPGERLKEVELAAAFGVSRASVRESLRILENRGLVRILPQRGAQVTLLSQQELENLFEIRAVLLGLAGRQAAHRFTAADRKVLASLVAALADGVADTLRYRRASAAMVAAVARLSGNAQLAEMIDGFAQRIGRYTRLGLLTTERRGRSLASWKKLLTALAARDEVAAEAISRRLALENRDAALVEIGRRLAPRRRPARAPA
jgi:DNA-binding GntR family transcriptional regulator